MASDELRKYDGTFEAPKSATFAIVASRFNHFIVEHLVDGALDALRRHGVADGRISVARTPGSFEIPLVCKRFASAPPKKRPDAILALGAVIRGATPHFDYVAAEVTKGCASVMLETGVVVVCGVLTTDTIEQAIERAGTKGGNKGWDAAMAALEMVSLGRALAADGI